MEQFDVDAHARLIEPPLFMLLGALVTALSLSSLATPANRVLGRRIFQVFSGVGLR